MTDIKEQISATSTRPACHQRHAPQHLVEQMRANPKLSPEGRRDAIAQVYQRGLDRHQALRERYDASLEQEREQMHDRLFVPQFNIGQPDYVRGNIKREYRQNLMEADSMLYPDGAEEYNVKGLLRYVETAELAGDELAQRAAFAIASNKGVAPVVERYLERHPEQAERYQQYKALDQEMREPTAMQKIQQMFELSPPAKPEELAEYQPGGTSGMAEIFGGGSKLGHEWRPVWLRLRTAETTRVT